MDLVTLDIETLEMRFQSNNEYVGRLMKKGMVYTSLAT